MLRGWDVFRHGNCSVVFISAYDGSIDYEVSSLSDEPRRVRYTKSDGLNNGWNRNIPETYKEAVNAFRCALESQFTAEKPGASTPS